MLAVALLLETFEEKLRDSMLLLWIDNKGVWGSFRKGASTCMEMSLMVARSWMKCAECNVDMHNWYVASKLNVADGPFRNDDTDMVRLKATFAEARLPGWLDTVWEAPTPLEAMAYFHFPYLPLKPLEGVKYQKFECLDGTFSCVNLPYTALWFSCPQLPLWCHGY